MAGIAADPIVLAGSAALCAVLLGRPLLQGEGLWTLAGRLLLFTMLSAALYYTDIVPYRGASQPLPVVQVVFAGFAKLAWWLSAALVSVTLVRLFLILERQPRDARLIQDLVVGLIYVGAALLALASVFSMSVGTLVATSGVFAIILGLALQSTLGDVFSGVALGIGRSYRIGDWIVLNDGTEGRVVETNWRATHLVNGANDVVVIPNSVLAKVSLTNFSSHDRSHGVKLTLRFVPTHAPRSIVAVMRTVLLSSNTILRTPEPGLEVRGLTAASLDIELSCRVADMSAAAAARTELFDLAYRHAHANGLLLAPPADAAGAPQATRRDNDLLTPTLLLGAMPLFRSLSTPEIEALAATAIDRSYQPGETLVDQDAVLEALVIIRRGTAIVTRRIASQDREVTRLSPGDSIGERGLLAGQGELGRVQALTPLLVIEIGGAGLRALIHDRPPLANELAGTLARRSSVERMAAATQPEDDTPWVLAQIQRLFAVPGHS